MIIARLNGQLGNQMFIYAAAYALAKKRNEKLCVYKYEFDTLFRTVGFQIGYLKIDKCSYYIGIPLMYYMDTTKLFLQKIVNKLTRRDVLHFKVCRNVGYDYLLEVSNTYTPFSIDDLKEYHIVEGFRQSPLYFDDYREDLIRQFQPIYQIDSETNDCIVQIHQTVYPVSVHIRRGDYVKIGCCLSMDYYEKAILLIKKKHPELTLFIFSDDINWVKDNLNIDGLSSIFVNHNHQVRAFDDIWAMSKCKSNIIANSSFSWWGAYLNTNDDKIVVAPSKILDNNNKILPAEWIVIKS